MAEEAPIFCARCYRRLIPGKGDFYEVRIEAMADPSPPVLDADDLSCDPSKEISRLVEEMKGMSEQELMDQVYRRVVLHLCRRCYERWIENPVG